MKDLFTSKVARITGVVAVAAVLAPAAYANGGAISHVYAPPPLDAGSAVPNPDYFPEVNVSLHRQRPDDRASWATVHGAISSLDTGSVIPNPDYFPEVHASLQGSLQRPDNRASWAAAHGTPSESVVVSSSGDGFDWADGGIGAAGMLAVVLLAAGSGLALQRNKRRSATA